MPTTPDDIQGGTTDADLLILRDAATNPSAVGEFRRNGGDLLAYDGIGLFNLRGSGGISADDHKTLLQLIHFIDEGPAEGFATGATKTITGGIFPTEVLWRRADTTALVRQSIAWSGVVPSSVVWRVYAADGVTVIATVTDAITYTGIVETSRTRSIA